MGTGSRVRLIDAHTPRLPTGDSKLFTVVKTRDAEGCFASVSHQGEYYCVPNEGANNTKEIFVILNALVNLSTTRSALPLTPTVLLPP